MPASSARSSYSKRSWITPRVMPIVAANLGADPPYFVMPRASHDLKKMLERGLSDHRDEAITIFEDVLDAIAHAHERGVLHRE